MNIPSGYKVSDNGMWTIREDKDGNEILTPISFSKIWISNRVKNADDNSILLKIKFYDDLNGENDIVLKQGEAFQKHGVMALVDQGAMFDESDARYIAQYLKDYLVANKKHITTSFAYPQFGWFDLVFVYGNTAISYRKETVAYDPVEIIGGDENAKEGIVAGRTTLIKDWIAAVQPLLQHERARFMCYCSVSAPLLRVLNAQSYAVHQYGETSCGKSTLNRLAISIWGDVSRLVNSGNVTVNYAEEFSQFCKDLPVVFDETQMTEKKDIVNIVYMLANETGKGRAKKSGGTRKTRKWKTVAMTSGESGITDDKTFAGADVRVVQLFNGLNANDEDAINHFEDRIHECWGAPGPILISEILQHTDEWKKVYVKGVHEFNKLSKSIKMGEDIKNVGHRLADTFALICTAGYLFEYLLHDIDESYTITDPVEVCQKVFQDMLFTLADRGYGQKAFDAFIDWFHSKRKFFSIDGMELSTRTFDYYGEIRDDCIDILPIVFENEFCNKHGYEKERVLKDWKQFDWIAAKNGRNTHLSRLNGSKPTRVIRINYCTTEKTPHTDDGVVTGW